MKEEKINNPFGEEFKKVSVGNLWIPTEEGDNVKGKVTKLIDMGADFGVSHEILQEDGTKIRLPTHAVLQSKLSDIKEGDNIGVVYLREELPKIAGRKPTKIYEVYKKD